MSVNNAALEAFHFLLNEYLDRQLPDDPAAEFIRAVCDRQTRPSAPSPAAPVPLTLPASSNGNGKTAPASTRSAATKASRSAALKAAWTRRKAEQQEAKRIQAAEESS